MNHSDISTIQQLANYLRCNKQFLERAIGSNFSIINFDSMPSPDINKIYVERFDIEKKGKKGGYRTVHKIYTYQLECTLKILNNYLSDLFEPDDCVHGFIPGRNTRSNAENHLAKKAILSVDIASFFDSIRDEVVANALEKIGFKKETAQWISQITTLDGCLPQGFNTSPTIANIVMSELDRELKDLCDGHITYTRYADDLYFSTNNSLPLVDTIREIVEKYGFYLNDEKTVIMNRGGKQFVTGLTVFDDKFPRIPKRIKRNLRLEIHKIKQHGYRKHAIRRLKDRGELKNGPYLRRSIQEEISKVQHRLFGWIHYIGSIEPRVASALYKKLISART